MVKNVLQVTVIFSIVILVFAFSNNKDSYYGEYTETKVNGNAEGFPETVEDALLMLGAEKPNHYIQKIDADSVRMGEEMIKFGALTDGTNKRLSKFFVCTDCHNLQLESADPADESPEAVLAYGMKNKLPFLPASTFYGMYNKTNWYNGDYKKKYGDLVVPTRDSLYNAIQLCAVQCSQGRKLDHWEVRAILHYFKSIQLKIKDLNFDQSDLDQFGKLMVNDKKGAQKMLRSKFNQINAATFSEKEHVEMASYKPNKENGRYIFNSGCLHCHDAERGITNFNLSDDKLSLRFLHKKKNKYNNYAVPHIARHGTYAITGRRQYMPLYSLEKMSDKQLLDLLFYIETKATE